MVFKSIISLDFVFEFDDIFVRVLVIKYQLASFGLGLCLSRGGDFYLLQFAHSSDDLGLELLSDLPVGVVYGSLSVWAIPTKFEALDDWKHLAVDRGPPCEWWPERGILLALLFEKLLNRFVLFLLLFQDPLVVFVIQILLHKYLVLLNLNLIILFKDFDL